MVSRIRLFATNAYWNWLLQSQILHSIPKAVMPISQKLTFTCLFKLLLSVLLVINLSQSDPSKNLNILLISWNWEPNYRRPMTSFRRIKYILRSNNYMYVQKHQNLLQSYWRNLLKLLNWPRVWSESTPSALRINPEHNVVHTFFWSSIQIFCVGVSSKFYFWCPRGWHKYIIDCEFMKFLTSLCIGT